MFISFLSYGFVCACVFLNMSTDLQRKTSTIAVQRNAGAVQKIFNEHHARAKALAGVSSKPIAGESYLPQRFAAASASNDVPSSGPLLPKHSAEAVTGRTLAGQMQPDWQQTSRRGLQAHKGHLDIPSHLSQQFELAMELKQQYGGSVGSSHGNKSIYTDATSASNGLSNPSSPSSRDYKNDEASPHQRRAGRPDHKELLHYDACERPGDPRCSNFAMTLSKSKHELYIPSTKENAYLTYSPTCRSHERGRSVPVNPIKARRERRAEFHRQQSIARYEKTLPLRRAADPYMQLTGAQADARVCVPTEYTLQLLSERNDGRHPVAGNPYRQEMYRGEPLMRQVLRGDFYDAVVPVNASRRTASSPPMRAGKQTISFIQRNKKNVKEWSNYNTSHRCINAS